MWKVYKIEVLKKKFTCFSVKCATIIGEMKPLVVPTKLMIPYNVPAKFGAKSCEFCKFVIVAAPLNPSESVMTTTIKYGLNERYEIDSRKRPGIMCAMNKTQLFDNLAHKIVDI